ncbi:hypothetical protein FQK07_14735 [Synechococcus sp. BSF8S]|uniref:hypothetical protein n=1 Tax=Synechococcales TaxID=1890424 RepID=UPI00162A6A3F|nr:MULTISPECIES: hypothetical protein [unclassified Synechococcus]MBC1262481.1 hypothetical protein [Synechococcus sp. BSF8S]MBC1265364.1 hypothetical protein [Synechococcus sp. BSA11S]
MQLRSLETRLAKLEKAVQNKTPKPQYGLAGNVLWTMDGGRTACDDKGKAVGTIAFDDIQRAMGWAVVVHEDSDIPLTLNGRLNSIPVWFPKAENGGDYLLRCDVRGAIPIECILTGSEPFPMSSDEKGRLIAPWSDWADEMRIVKRWDNYRLPDLFLDFIDVFECEWLSELWREKELRSIKLYSGIRNARLDGLMPAMGEGVKS